eukprot:TRINITY_DN5186_c0_g1_i1.p1 TRINITY_DN5186_c0_g1~~TRINITY_DN5186_c0_g1_i1.p1  ORF type:complete len:268 (-),score=57.70 TRINITY_DN5186_c0_g1_i1:5-775(-)
MIAVLGMLLAACVVRAEKMHTPNKHRLKAVFDELGGPKWRNSNGWVPFEGTDPCEGGWYGVGCDEDGYLESLNLANNGLSGEIPGRDLGMWSNLKHMLTLDFSSNELRGNFLGLTELENLQTMNLSRNAFAGEMPDELETMVDLAVLDLSHNQLTGFFDILFLSPSLREVNLSHNKLQGNLDAGMKMWRTLASLDISHNQFTGPLPVKSLKLLHKKYALRHMDVTGNMFECLTEKQAASLPFLVGHTVCAAPPKDL